MVVGLRRSSGWIIPSRSRRRHRPRPLTCSGGTCLGVGTANVQEVASRREYFWRAGPWVNSRRGFPAIMCISDGSVCPMDDGYHTVSFKTISQSVHEERRTVAFTRCLSGGSWARVSQAEAKCHHHRRQPCIHLDVEPWKAVRGSPKSTVM